eukprot:1098319-Pleurochrysis_carterae.AAC.1
MCRDAWDDISLSRLARGAASAAAGSWSAPGHRADPLHRRRAATLARTLPLSSAAQADQDRPRRQPRVDRVGRGRDFVRGACRWCDARGGALLGGGGGGRQGHLQRHRRLLRCMQEEARHHVTLG